MYNNIIYCEVQAGKKGPFKTKLARRAVLKF